MGMVSEFKRNQIIFAKYYSIAYYLGPEEIDNFISVEKNCETKHVQYFISNIIDKSITKPTKHICILGSNESDDWKYNLRFKKVNFEYKKEGLKYNKKFFSDNIKIHKGFYESARLIVDDIFDYICNIIKKTKKDKLPDIIFTGHSFGSAVATLAAYIVKLKLIDKYGSNCKMIDNIYGVTIGAPRVGNKTFKASFYNLFQKQFVSYGMGNDIITKVPPILFGYKHIKQYINLRYNTFKLKRPLSLKDHLPEINTFRLIYYLRNQSTF